jgi:hypothetical protein
MRRLLRILFNALTVLSLVLAVLVAGLWVRSYFAGDTWFYSSFRDEQSSLQWTQQRVVLGRGGFGYHWARRVFQNPQPTFRPSAGIPEGHSSITPRYPNFPFMPPTGTRCSASKWEVRNLGAAKAAWWSCPSMQSR